jgi:hypothetical protein
MRNHLLIDAVRYVCGCLPLVAMTIAAQADDFSLTGSYEGLYACDSTTGGVPSTWARPMEAGVIQDGDKFTIDLRYTDRKELGGEYSLYAGQLALSPSGEILSGYFGACSGTFPSKELARIFPAATASVPFSMSITSIWASDSVPNTPGLTVQTCKWSLTRKSTQTPVVRPCVQKAD